MKPLILAILIGLVVNDPAYAQSPKKQKSGFDKFLKSLFTPRTVAQSKAKPKRRHIAEKPAKRTRGKPEREPRTVAVDPEWMARYWELEAAWDYPIPEDDQIKWKDGKYIVPILVFKHYEDLFNTPRRIASPQSNFRPGIDRYSIAGDG